MKYKVGDKVRIREDLEINKAYSGLFFNDDMNRFKRDIATIIICFENGYYKIDLDGAHWLWNDELLEPCIELNKEHFAKEIIEIVISRGSAMIAVMEETGMLCGCTDINCQECLFKNENCREARKKWANSEYIEPKPPIKLTQFEYDLLRTNEQSHDKKIRDFKTYLNMKEVGHYKGVLIGI